jgi:L-methionine (R)-S-oxide reductase
VARPRADRAHPNTGGTRHLRGGGGNGRTEIVGDVNADERYIACFVSTRAEIVVPVINDGRVVAEIDIDSDTPAAFGESDRELLERVAALIGPYCARPQ